MHIKRIHEMEEKLTEIALCEINKGIECVNTAEMGAVIDMIKDLACAEKDAREAKEMGKEEEDEKKENEYFLKMLKEEYGDEEGERRFYDNYRYKSSGRFAPKGRGSYIPRRGYEEPPYYHMMPEDYKAHDAEWYRDMDRKSRNVMYFSEPMVSGNMRNDMSGKANESRYDRARRGYSESKQTHKSNSPEDNSENMRNLEKVLNIIAEDVREYMPNMSPSEKAMAKQKIDGISKSIQ